MHRCAGPQEGAQLLRDWAVSPPILEWVEDKLVAAIGVLLPAVELVVDGPTAHVRLDIDSAEGACLQ